MTDDQTTPTWLKHLPNQLTIGRIAAVPLILVLYPLDFFALNIICGFLFLIAALTDYLDGWLARRYNVITNVGALLDPIADKMLVVAGLIVLVHANSDRTFFPWLAGTLLCRDIGISALRLIALEKKVRVPVNQFGKWKTVAVDTSVFCLLVNHDLFGLPVIMVGWISLWVGLVLSLYSAYLYVTGFLENTKDISFSD